MLAGDDVIGIAQTGTGKTASFVLPLLNKVANNRRIPRPKSCGALILTPTRELSAQIADGIARYGKHIKHHATVVVGGARPGPQVKAMARGLDILVATPGRLEDHMRSGAIRLDETTTVILDEADQMLDLGFMPAIRRIMAALPKTRQTALLSATMPKQIRALAQDFLNNPREISVTPVSKPIERIAQSVRHMSKGDKRDALVNILKGDTVERAIVFTRTKHGANKVAQHLEKFGISAGAIHGNKSQNQRERTLADFRKGSVPVLVATDIAARGIDVDGVSHVVNFELPNVPEVYVHRIGRTARAGNSGIAISLCDETERAYLRDIERLTGLKVPIDGEGPQGPDQAPEPQGARNRGGRQGERSQKPAGNRNRSRNGGGAARQARGTGQRETERNAEHKPARAENAGRGERQSRQGGEARQAKQGGQDRNDRQGRNERNDRQETNSNRPRRAKRSGGNSGGNGENRPPRKGEGDTSSAGLARMLGNIERSQSKARTQDSA